MYQTKTYQAWRNARVRCYTKTHRSYPHYGAKGIVVCDRWLHSFENFLEDMGECPSGMTLERNDSSKNYEPDNCMWAPRKDQDRNRTNNVNVTINSKTQCIADWSRELGIPDPTLRYRYKQGLWPKT